MPAEVVGRPRVCVRLIIQEIDRRRIMAKPLYSLPRVVSQIQSDWQWNGPDISHAFPDTANGNKDENAGFTAMTGFQIGMARGL